MAAAAYFETVQKIYIAFYQRPADPAGLKYWAEQINAAGGNPNAVITAFGTSPEATALYGAVNATTIGNVIEAIYQAAFNRAADAGGKAYWIAAFNAGTITASSIALAVVQGATGGDDAITIANKLQVANEFTKQVDGRALTDPYFGTGSNFNATYAGDADAQAARDILKTVTANPASVLNPSQVTTEIQNKIANPGDPIGGQTSGQIFTLTVGEDKLTGSTGNDTFNGLIVQANDASAKDTLESFDVLDGGAGTDTLNATINSGTPAPVLKNIENVNLRFTAAKSVDLTSATGVTTIKVENSTGVGTVDGVGSVARLAVANQLKDVNFDSSTATTLALNLDTIANATGATQVKVDLGKVTAAHKATTLNITANNANVELLDTKGTNVTTTLTVAATGTNTLKLTEAVKATTVTVTGTGSADLTGAAFTGALTKFDASANTGGVKAALNSTKAIAVTGGEGADVITFAGVTGTDNAVSLGKGNDTLFTGALIESFSKGVDGGDGTDIINITDGSKLTATSAKYITNFETLDVSGAAASTFDVSLNSFATVQIDEALGGALKGDVKFDKASDTFTLNILSKVKDGAFDVVKNTVVALKDDAGTTAKGDAETFTLVATINDGNKNSGADGINAQQITVANVEKLVVTSNVATTDGAAVDTKAAAHTLTAKFVADKAETISITGNGGVDLSSVTTIGVVTKVDASGSTGNVTVKLSTQANSVAYTGSEGVDTYTASAKGDTIYTGKGADVIDLTASTGAARDTFVLKAATDSQVTDTSKDGKITLGADTGFDAITKFNIGGGITADRIDLTNFGFSGAQRGVENVSAKVVGTTDLTSVVDLFSSVAGDRGVAFSNLGGADTYVFIDANKDGDFTAANDIVIKLTGVTSISEADINF